MSNPIRVDFSSNATLTQCIVANTTSQMITIPSTGRSLVIRSAGNESFVIWGTNDVTATLANSSANGSYFVESNRSILVAKMGATRFAAITSSGTANVYVTVNFS